MLSIERISKNYKGGIRAVDDLSFTVEPGMVKGILGPNGAGKTTTIRMILNIIRPDAGQIVFNGQPVGEASKDFIGYLPEERGLYRKSTIHDALYYFASLKSIHGAEASRRINNWLERFELGGMGKRKVEELSKGNQQKVQFIASVLHNPSLLILDEPFSGLDPVNQLKFKDIVLSVRDEGKAIIFCTHQLESAEKICDSILLMNKGKAVLNGTVEQIKRSHGSNAIRMEFEGDANFVRSLPTVASADIYQNYAELNLVSGATLMDLIPNLLPHLKLTHIGTVQPSLLSIFIDTVGRENITDEFLQQASEGKR